MSESSPSQPVQGEHGWHDSNDGFRFIAVLRQRWLTVVLFGLATVSVVMAATFRADIGFSSSARLYLGELSSRGSPAAEEVEIAPGVQGDISSEVEILTSRSLVAKAILASGMNARLTQEGERLPNYWEWRASGRDPALFDPALRKVRATETVLTERTRDPLPLHVHFKTTDVYEVRKEPDGIILGKGVLGETLRLEAVTITLVRAASGHPEPGDTFELNVAPVSETVDVVLDGLSVSAAKGSGIAQPNVVSLFYSDGSPLMAAEFLRALMQAYLKERQDWKTQDASAAEAFVTTQLVTMRAALDKAQKDLAEFRTGNRVVVLDSEAEAMIGQISRYEEQRVAARLEAAALADVDRALATSNPAPEAFMLGEARDTVLASLAASLSESRRKLVELETRFSEQAPDVVNQRAQVDAQLRTIRSYVSNRLARARENLATLSGVIGNYEGRLRTVPSAELGLAQLTREAEVYNALYAFLLKRQQQAAIAKASTVSKNRILDEPEVPFWEDTPRLGLRFASAPLGLLLGAFFVLVTNLFRTSYQNSSDIYASLGNISVFATIPKSMPSHRRLKGRDEFGRDVMSSRVSFGFLEAFRTLRTNLYLAAPGVPNEGCVVLVTSPTPGDGKTTCALSLAWILAADGKQVLVVDADLRKPSHFAIGRPDDEALEPNAAPKDLSSVLNGECSWRDAARPIQGTQTSIYSLCVERPAAAELLSGANMRPFLNQARRDFDYIILDSPSFPLVSDALVMAPAADVVLSVIRPAHTPRKLAYEHMKRINSASNSYAVVVNDTAQLDAYGGAYPRPKQVV